MEQSVAYAGGLLCAPLLPLRSNKMSVSCVICLKSSSRPFQEILKVIVKKNVNLKKILRC